MDNNKVRKTMKFDRKSNRRTTNKRKEKCALKLAAKSGYKEKVNSAKNTELADPPGAHEETLTANYWLADRFTTIELQQCGSSLKNPASQYQVRNEVRERGRAPKKGNARRQRHPSKYCERKPLATTTSEGCSVMLVNNQTAEITSTASSKQLPKKKIKHEQEDLVYPIADEPKFTRDRRTRFQVAKTLDKKTSTVWATVEAESPELGRKSSKLQIVSDSVHTQNNKCNYNKSLEYTNDKMDVDILDNVKTRKRKYNSIITRPVPVCGEEIPFNSESAESSFDEEEPVLAKKRKFGLGCNVPYQVYEDSGKLTRTPNEVKQLSPPCNISNKQQSGPSSYFSKESQGSCVKALQYLMTQSKQQFMDCTIIFNCASLRGNSRKEDSARDMAEGADNKYKVSECMETEKNPNLVQNNEIEDDQILHHVFQLEGMNNASLKLPHVPQHEATQVVNEDGSEPMSEGDEKDTVNSTIGSDIHSMNSKIVTDISKSTQTELSYHQQAKSPDCQEGGLYNNDGIVTQPEMQAQIGIRSEIHSSQGPSGMFQLLETHWGCFQNLAKKLSAITSRIKLISREASRMHIFSSLFYITSDDKTYDSTESSSVIRNDDKHCSTDNSYQLPPQIYRCGSMDSLPFNGQFKHPSVEFNISAINSNRTPQASLQEEPQYLWKVTANGVVSQGAANRSVQNAWDIIGYKQYIANCLKHKSKLVEQRDNAANYRGCSSNYDRARNRHACKSCLYDQLVFRAMHSNCAPFNVGDFVVNFSDLRHSNPPIWQVSPNKVLLKYVPFDYKGKIRYRSVSIYGALNAEKLETHVKVPVEVCFKFGRREIVEISENELFWKSKAFVEHSISESARFERSFLIYIQSLLSQCLYPSFLSEIYKANDLYFTQNIRSIDDMNENCQRKIIKEVQLAKELLNNLDTLPFLNVSNLSSDDMKYGCSVCKKGDVCAKLHLSGNPYDRKMLRELSKWDFRCNNAELLVCISCLIKIHLYNQVAHHKYHMFLDFLTLTSKTRERSPDKGYYDLIDQQMSDGKWIDELFLSLRVVWARIEQLSMMSII